MNHHALTLLILELNHLLDTGKFDDITIDQIHRSIGNGSILRDLRNIAEKEIDLSILLDTDAYGDFEGFYTKQMQGIYDAYAGDERRKWGIENKGICLLIAWTNEILQQGHGWKPNENIVVR